MGAMKDLQIDLVNLANELEAKVKYIKWALVDPKLYTADPSRVSPEVVQLAIKLDALLNPPDEREPEQLAWDEGSHEWVCPHCRQNLFKGIITAENEVTIRSHNRFYMVEEDGVDGDWSDFSDILGMFCVNCLTNVRLPKGVEILDDLDPAAHDPRMKETK